MSPLIVIPAAGASSRMRGRDKLVESVNGMPLLRRQTLAALDTGCPVVVTLPPGPGARREAIHDLSVHIEDVPDATEGLGASLRRAAGLLAQGQGQAMGILLPDVPGIAGPDIRAVLEVFRETGEAIGVRASDIEGKPGTPLFLPHRIARLFAGLKGDTGGKSLLEGEEVRLVPLSDDRATTDLDTPEAWKAWRDATGIAD